MSEEKKSFLGTIADQLLKWDSQIDELKKKAVDATGEQKQKIEKQLAEIIGKKEDLRNRSDEIRRAGEDAWKAAKQGLEKAANDLSASFKSMLDSFNKKN